MGHDALVTIIITGALWIFTAGIYVAQLRHNTKEISSLREGLSNALNRIEARVEADESRLKEFIDKSLDRLEQLPCKNLTVDGCLGIKLLLHRIQQLESKGDSK